MQTRPVDRAAPCSTNQTVEASSRGGVTNTQILHPSIMYTTTILYFAHMVMKCDSLFGEKGITTSVRK
jgi:hypothetical protein